MHSFILVGNNIVFSKKVLYLLCVKYMLNFSKKLVLNKYPIALKMKEKGRKELKEEKRKEGL